jgi:aminodeoxychorismate synthase component I
MEQASEPFCWFDSSRRSGSSGRQSVLCEASSTAVALGRSCRRDDARPQFAAEMRCAFERGRARRDIAPDARAEFLGGWIGYLGYEAQIEFDPALPDRNEVLPFPRGWFLTADRGVTVSHEDDTTTLWEWTHGAGASETLEGWAELLQHEHSGGNSPPAHPWSVANGAVDPEWHRESVAEILRRIAAGDVYQVNLTTPVRVQPGSDPLGLYLRLREVSPGAYSGFLRLPGLTVLASSPEQFFSVRGDRVVSRPMKGTRARAAEDIRDREVVEELRSAEKDRAENLMIVDLIRNDLGKVAKVGSVEVERLFDVETYTTVHQMTSTVVASLAGGQDVFSVLGALFPPGSMTGAPKVEACRVIRALEPTPRGLYSGCLGLIDWRGDAVFNVVIRTLVGSPSGWSWSVGGGIVADSTPELEYQEALDKLAALNQTLSRSS